MRKFLIKVAPIVLLLAAGLSYFCAFQFLHAGIRSWDKALIILLGLWAVFSGVLLTTFALLYRRKDLGQISAGILALASLAALIAGFLFSLISPIPQPKDPSNWQVIEIIAAPGLMTAGDGRILIEEIKLDGNPIPFHEINLPTGWNLTEFGIESEGGSSTPLLIQRKGPTIQGAALLLGKGPQNGATSIRFGWNSFSVDTFRADGDSQMVIEIPATNQIVWVTLFNLSVCLAAATLFLVTGLILLPIEGLLSITGKMKELRISVLFWIMAGFFINFVAFSFTPVFLNSSNVMQVENDLPTIYPIGNDLHLILKSARSLVETNSPYAGANKYPPFAAGLFTTLLGLNIREAFRVLSTANLFFFTFLALGVPFWLSGKKRLEDFAWMLFIAGLFSYPFAFEVERGQFNLMAMALVFGALLLYHRAPKWKWLAFALFCAGVQLKIYPAVFVLLFTRDWRDWKANLLRWAGLGLANLALLTAFGWQVFMDFVAMMSNVVIGLGVSDDPVNHSVNGFLQFMNYHAALTPETARVLQILLSLVIAALLGLCWWSAYRRREVLDPYLILSCTLAALMLPSLSNDYTLAYLIGPAILFFGRLQTLFDPGEGAIRRRDWVPLAVCALAFSGTFFSYYHKPLALQNQFPMMLLLLGCVAWFSVRETTTNNGTH